MKIGRKILGCLLVILMLVISIASKNVASGSSPGAISINGGAATTTTTSVTLTITAPTGIGMISDMMITNDSLFTGAVSEAFASTKSWTLTSGLGTKTVYIKFLGDLGWTAAKSDTIDLVSASNSNPVISLSTPTTNQTYSAQAGYKTITITGKVSDPDANNVTVSATINGKTKSTTVNNAPTSPPGSDNFTLTWDVAADGIAEGTYNNLSVGANDGNGGMASATLAPTLTVDKTPPTGGSVSINNGASIVNTSSVNLTIGATGANQMMLSNEPLDGIDNTDGSMNISDIADYSVISKTWTITTGQISRVHFTGSAYMSDEGWLYYLQSGTWQEAAYHNSSVPGGVWDEWVDMPAGVTQIKTQLSIYQAVGGSVDAPEVVILGADTTWGAYSTSKAWTLSTGDGTQRVYVKFSDAVGNVGSIAIDSITLDTITPTVNAPTSSNVTSTSFRVTAHATDTSPLQYQFNLNGTDVGIWQASVIYDFTGLTANTAYTVKYKAKDSAGNISAYSSILNVTTLAPSDTTPPTVNAPTSSSITATSFVGTANASDPSTPLQYLFNLNGVDQGTWQAGNTYTFTGLTASTTYTIKYMAKDAVGNISGYSATLNVTTTTPPPPAPAPGTPTVMDIGNDGDGRDISVSFKGAGNETNISGYRIYVVPSAKAGTFDAGTAEGLPSTKYISEPKTGIYKMHTMVLNQYLKDTDGNNIVNNTAYKIFILSFGANGYGSSLSPASAALTLTTGATHVGGARIFEVRDLNNSGNASDIRLIFYGASDEANISGYKVFIVPSANAGTFTVDSVYGAASTTYISEPAKGAGRMHLFTLGSAQQDNSGNPIDNATTYKLFVVSRGMNGKADGLSLGSADINLTVNNLGTIKAQKPTAKDTANSGKASDITVTFKKPQSEANVQQYKIFIVPISAGNLNIGQTVGNTNCSIVIKKNIGTSYTVKLDDTVKDSTGNAIANNISYKVYILTEGANGYANILSDASLTFKLSQYVPAVNGVRGVSTSKVGTGHNSSNITVTFIEPSIVSNIQEYRIMIAPASVTFTQALADGAINYQTVNVGTKGASHSITLNAGLNAYNGTVLAAGSYKLYVQAVGKNGVANKFMGANAIVKLD